MGVDSQDTIIVVVNDLHHIARDYKGFSALLVFEKNGTLALKETWNKTIDENITQVKTTKMEIESLKLIESWVCKNGHVCLSKQDDKKKESDVSILLLKVRP